MTGGVPGVPGVEREEAGPGARGRGWLPALVVVAGAAGVFLWCGVSGRDLLAFGAYLGGGVALPGVLLWRALTGGGRSVAEDVAAGLALGYAVEVPAYLAARAAGVPVLVIGPAVVVVGAFVAVPRLRRHWRGAGVAGSGAGAGAGTGVAGSGMGAGAGRERVPGWCAWGLAGVVGYLVVWSALFLYRVPVGRAYVDLPYHLALVGELKRQVPPTFPSVLGEPLSYHWFVHAEMAATSWVTGIEPVTLVYRLSTLPMTAALVVLVAVLGRRVGGGWGAGAAAVGVTYFLFGPVLREGVVFTSRSMFTAWASPTQTFGGLLFAPVVLLLVGRVRGRSWVALGLLLAALTGAKATFLPLLLAGLVLVAVVRWVVERRVPGEWLGAAALVLGFLVVAQVVVFRSGGQGTVVAPLATARGLWGAVAGIRPPELAAVPVAPVAVLACVHLFCLACVWGGVAGLGRRVWEPPWSLLVGMGGAGIGAVLVLGHPAESQLYFLESVRPYLSVAAVCGVVTAWRARAGMGRMVAWAGVGAVVAWVVAGAGGLLVAEHVRPEAGALPTVEAVRPGAGVLGWVVGPYLVLAVVALVVWRRGAVLAVAGLMAGYGVPASVREVVEHVVPGPDLREREVPRGGREAARWIRGHSAPGDVVATDLHCRPVTAPACDSRHYWVAGFSERRVLVEGWAYAESTLSRTRLFGGSYLEVPFADGARLAANDAVFAAPTRENVQKLARVYGVRWLLSRNDSKLDGYAALRFRNREFSVHELVPR
ncbi:hypothetical protein [Nonomuraea sp. NPDC050783]|uniref:hypothetical protein n=1 Tax=Nonomuraea sp. NPDC050783 TaxID=3154634 RepID=UPI003465F0C5